MKDPDVDVHWSSDHSGPGMGTFDFVISAVPAPATLRIRFDPMLPSLKREALSNTSYVSAGKTLIHCSRRHWEANDSIFGGNSVTDLPHQQSWYPSDNAAQMFDPDEEPGVEYGSPLRIGAFNESATPSVPFDAYWKAADSTVSDRPGVFLAAYLWGPNAKRFAALSGPERTELIVSSVRMVHPDNDRYMDQDPVHLSWDEEWNPGGGAFAFFKVGEQRRYQDGLSAPVLDSRGEARVFFAGEHVAIAHGWIQSAFQSALAATISILQAP
jgi:monoamine oxidase